MAKTRSYRCIAVGLSLLTAASAYGEETAPSAFKGQPISQTVYKGVIGTLLEEVPIEPEKRVDLQRGSTVISSTLSGRSLAIMLGVANPVLMAVGLAWGLFAASKIASARAEAPPSNPFPGGLGTTVSPAVVSESGMIAQPSGMLLCMDTEPEIQSVAAPLPAEPPASSH